MRSWGVACVLPACWLNLAYAQTPPAPAPEYPLADTDRPLLHLAGTTTLDVSLDVPVYTATTVDAMGNTTKTTTLGHDLDVVLQHSFADVELAARVAGAFASAEARAQLGCAVAVDYHRE